MHPMMVNQLAQEVVAERLREAERQRLGRTAPARRTQARPPSLRGLRALPGRLSGALLRGTLGARSLDPVRSLSPVAPEACGDRPCP